MNRANITSDYIHTVNAQRVQCSQNDNFESMKTPNNFTLLKVLYFKVILAQYPNANLKHLNTISFIVTKLSCNLSAFDH